jgi:hypothetical protein
MSSDEMTSLTAYLEKKFDKIDVNLMLFQLQFKKTMMF